MGRRVAEGEGMLSAIRVELGKVEARYVEVCAERNRLADAVDDLREQQEAERQRVKGRLEALESRAAAAERQVAEMRQRLIERTEEARAFICKAAEATIARATAERRLAALEVSQGVRGQGDDDPTETRTALSEFLRALNLRSREMALAGSAEKLAALTERKRSLAADSQSQRAGAGTGIAGVMAALPGDRQRHGEIEDALEAARKANARLESEVASLRSGLEDVAGAAGPPNRLVPDKVESRSRPIAPPKPGAEPPTAERLPTKPVSLRSYAGLPRTTIRRARSPRVGFVRVEISRPHPEENCFAMLLRMRPIEAPRLNQSGSVSSPAQSSTTVADTRNSAKIACVEFPRVAAGRRREMNHASDPFDVGCAPAGRGGVSCARSR